MKPDIHSARKTLPGHVRQRVKSLIDDLGDEPRPTKSKTLRLPETVEGPFIEEWEVRRVRLENWRIVYAINETWKEIGILTIQKRPPYDYEDLESLLSSLS
jgi:mRNA interferase RelE/StbE